HRANGKPGDLSANRQCSAIFLSAHGYFRRRKSASLSGFLCTTAFSRKGRPGRGAGDEFHFAGSAWPRLIRRSAVFGASITHTPGRNSVPLSATRADHLSDCHLCFFFCFFRRVRGRRNIV